jgi:hypothetical protein
VYRSTGDAFHGGSRHLAVYPQVWLQYDKKAYGYIPVSLLRPFLRRLKQPLGGPEPPKEFTTWYLAVFPMIACHAKKNRVKYRDVLMALTTHAVDAKVRGNFHAPFR